MPAPIQPLPIRLKESLPEQITARIQGGWWRRRGFQGLVAATRVSSRWKHVFAMAVSPR
jgi:hypothetical protein